MQFSTTGGGLGSTPFGALLGGGDDSTWGLFDATHRWCVSEVSCESCQRVRLSRVLGGFTYLGSYVDGGYIYVVGADDEALGHISIRLEGGDQTYSVSLRYSADPVLPVVVVAPDMTSVDEPGSGVADVLLRGTIPDTVTGTYNVTLVDSCSGVNTDLGTIDLEASAMILLPRDADLGGASRLWLQGYRLAENTTQPASGAPSTVPFDKVTVLYEYDVELDSLPSDQGFALVAGSDASHQLVSGAAYDVTGAVTFNIAAGGEGCPDTLHVYTRFQDTGCTGSSASQSGFSIGCGGVNATAGFGCGALVTERVVSAFFTPSVVDLSDAMPPGWLDFGASGDVTGANAVWYGDQVVRGDAAITASGPPACGGGFACIAGTTSGAVKHFVMCGPGRFIRAKWLAVTPVAAPTLRFYFVADSASGARTARFRIGYGPASAGPYARPDSSVEFTVNCSVPNSVVEAAATLSGLTPNSGFYFTVERVWDHVDDVLNATAHLLYTTVRSV